MSASLAWTPSRYQRSPAAKVATSLAAALVADRLEFGPTAARLASSAAEAEPSIEIAASSDVSIWADVTWSYDGPARERFVYQLVRRDERWQIAVLTPLTLP